MMMGYFNFMKRNRIVKKIDKLHREHNFAEAWTLLESLMEKAPNDSLLLLHAAIHTFETEEYNRSQQFIEKALALQQDNPILHLAMGEILYAKKDYEESVRYLQKALELSPDNPKAEYLLGMNYIMRGKWEEASQHFEIVAREDRDFLLARLLTIGEALFKQQE